MPTLVSLSLQNTSMIVLSLDRIICIVHAFPMLEIGNYIQRLLSFFEKSGN